MIFLSKLKKPKIPKYGQERFKRGGGHAKRFGEGIGNKWQARQQRKARDKDQEEAERKKKQYEDYQQSQKSQKVAEERKKQAKKWGEATAKKEKEKEKNIQWLEQEIKKYKRHYNKIYRTNPKDSRLEGLTNRIKQLRKQKKNL